MSQQVFGKVFPEGSGKGTMCRLKLEGRTLVAIENRPAEGSNPQIFKIELQGDNLTFGGSDHSQLILKGEGITLYAERSALEAPLRALGLNDLNSVLDSEVVKVGGLRRRAWYIGIGVIVALILLLYGVNWGLDMALYKAVDAVPVSWEEKLGELAFTAEESQVVTDPAIAGPVQKIVDKLVAAADDPRYKFDVKVIRDEQINAFAAPGGKVVVFTGLLDAAETPEEVAGVLAHEIQHVLRRHSLKGIAQRLKWTLVVAICIGDVGSMQEAILAKAPALMELSFGRSMEREADQRGFALLKKADIDPAGLRTFFKRLQEEKGDIPGVLKMLSTHPMHEERVEYLDQMRADLGTQAFPPLEVEWDGLKEALKKGQ